MQITEIENLTEEQAKEMALETMNIKDHNVYFVNCGSGFDYSVLVFKNNHHIYYANDYKLHHSKDSSDGELREIYIKSLNHKLYTEQELTEPIKDYDDYEAKRHYLANYYPMQVDHISYFFIGSDEEREQMRKKVAKMIDNKIGLCYNYQKDKDFVDKMYYLFNELCKREEERNTDFDYLKSAFIKEMYNHEYAINSYQRNYDTLSAFGNVKWHGENDDPEDYFKDLNFTETQKKAYYAARKQYYKEVEEKGLL